eukprot:9342520-Alexandrium_andersonii.AAC.1
MRKHQETPQGAWKCQTAETTPGRLPGADARLRACETVGQRLPAMGCRPQTTYLRIAACAARCVCLAVRSAR